MARLTGGKNRRGILVINNKVQKIGKGDHDPIEQEAVDTQISEFLDPLIDTQVKSIEAETQELRIYGRLKPFREGEPIGTLPRRRRTTRERHDPVKLHNERMEYKRTEMLRLREQNDRIIRDLLKREKLYGRGN